jgi:catechol 2,3-dioxygenase-like lactoylglutathione lyase family enzyme
MTSFDHVALALPDARDFWSLFGGALGGRWAGGGESLGGFAFSQARFANGMKVEALEPFSPESNDFLVRFLATSGAGPHHLTFLVDDLEASLGRVRAAGYRPVGVDLDGEHWKEAFLSSREAGGIVVQLAWADGEPTRPPPAWLPPPPAHPAAELVHVAHAVADLPAALVLAKGLLDGRSIDAGAGGGLGWVDVGWPGDGRLRLVAGDPVAPWLSGRSGRLHHLCFRLEEPGALAGAVARDGWWDVPPTTALGTRLVLVEPGAPPPVMV